MAIIEADFPWALERIANRLKMDFIHSPGTKGSVALLSRFPIRESVNLGLLSQNKTRQNIISHSLLRAVLTLPDQSELPIGVVQLCQGSGAAQDAARLAEISVVLKSFEQDRIAGRRHILMGDFNVHAGGVIKALLDAGYQDTLAASNPTAAEKMGTYTTQNPSHRFDYIFSFGIEPAKITEARIEQDRLAKYASDHFPVFAEIQIGQP